MKSSGFYLAFVSAVVLMAASPAAQAPMQAKIDAEIAALTKWSTDSVIVSGVKAQNAAPGAGVDAMSQETWTAAGPDDALVRALTSNRVAAVIGTHKSAAASEVFVNAADGRKVAFLTKTTSWSHKGSPKHEVPMTGKVWQGQAEMDQSTRVESIQIAVPVLDGTTPIGSIVVGLDVAKLK